ncbi:hypothetical protein MMC19_005858 [Ptychographa xylographoides]|nr:hypothetical protein [Ptychographa xylographoides]
MAYQIASHVTKGFLTPSYRTQHHSSNLFNTSPSLPLPDEDAVGTASDNIPFQSHTGKLTSQDDADFPEDTITAPERAIFDRIFKKLVTTNHLGTSQSDDPVSDTIEDELSGDEQSLDSIFDHAFKTIEQRPEEPPRNQDPEISTYPPEVQREPRPDFASKPDRPKRQANQPSIRAVERTRTLFPPSLQRSLDQTVELILAKRPLGTDGQKSKGFTRIDMAQSEDTSLESSEPVDEYERLVQEARREDLSRVTALLDAARNDIEIWRVLQKEVFARVTELSAFLKKEEREKKAAAATTRAKNRLSRKAQASALDTHPDPEVSTTLRPTEAAKSEPQDAKLQGRHHESFLTSTMTISTKNIAPELPPSQPIPALPPQPAIHPLSLLQTNYSPHLLHALRLLRRNHPASPYAPALIPHIRRLGPISYVLGASTALYNEMLYIRWVHYRDCHACADLVQEMVGQGISVDGVSHAVFEDAEKMRARARRVRREGKKVGGLGGLTGRTGTQAVTGPDAKEDHTVTPVVASWWTLQGVVSGFDRWRAADAEGMQAWQEEKDRRDQEKAEIEIGEDHDEAWTGDGQDESAAEVDIALLGDTANGFQASEVAA